MYIMADKGGAGCLHTCTIDDARLVGGAARHLAQIGRATQGVGPPHLAPP